MTLSWMGATAKHGFTMIELLVVIAILGVLAGLGAIGVSKTLRGSENTKRAAFARVVNSAIAAYKNETGDYPIADSASADDNNQLVYGTVTSSNGIDRGNVEVMMKLLGRTTSGNRDSEKRAYITDTSMLYVCKGKRVSKLDDILASGSLSASDMIGFPITMTKASKSSFKSLSKARAFAPIKITFNFDLDDFSVTVAGEGDFTNVVKLH